MSPSSWGPSTIPLAPCPNTRMPTPLPSVVVAEMKWPPTSAAQSGRSGRGKPLGSTAGLDVLTAADDGLGGVWADSSAEQAVSSSIEKARPPTRSSPGKLTTVDLPSLAELGLIRTGGSSRAVLHPRTCRYHTAQTGCPDGTREDGLVHRDLDDGYVLDDDRDRIDRDSVAAYLSEQTYWALGRPCAVMAELFDSAWRLGGLYDREGSQVGFARAVSDG